MKEIRVRPNRLPRRHDERGVVIPMTALVLIPLMIIAAFSIDVGGWYAQTSRMQRAADAAALAGVVWMPDLNQATDVARETAAKNGYVHDDGSLGTGVIVDVTSPGQQKLKVEITSPGELYLGQLVMSSITFKRSGTAEYNLPVPLGSPKNIFGSGSLLPAPDTENFWAAVNGYCAGHESGDLKLARNESYTSAANAATSQCNSSPPSAQTADYDPDGYLYAVELPTATSSLTIEAYDAGYNQAGSLPDLALTSELQTINTKFEVFEADDTPLDRNDNDSVALISVGTNDPAYANQWKALHTFFPAKAGTYYVRVWTDADLNESRASNGFALRAYTGGSFSLCSSIVGATGFSANCPEVHGVDDMSVFANLASGGSGTASFYLAKVEARHAGKLMRVQLFDSGEGAAKIEVLDPNGDPVSFDWSTPCSPPTPPSGGCTGSGASLDVSGSGTQPFTGLRSDSKYNDRRMALDIALPDNYATVYGANEWWKIKYTLDATPTDRTTWSVSIIGDPVHLVE
jgi:hypothetical protein